MNCFKDFPTKEIIKKIALLCEFIPKTLQSSTQKKGQEEAWRMIEEAFGGWV